MILCGAKLSDHVIHVNLDLMMNHVMEQGDHSSLINGPRIFQTERHDVVHKDSPMFAYWHWLDFPLASKASGGLGPELELESEPAWVVLVAW